ncbi:type II toxin-antitoxin system RelE/ParE family toxin [Microbacterium sp.]|uniref:type II toxin-antitoxin system RelE/ParE family toxin n=1 Tax=Microbacterium sp. TaxID=51671 RepID=UPI003C723B37
MSFDYVVVAEARTDIRDILIWSHARFGAKVREGYEELIFTAFEDIASDPGGAGVHVRSDLGDGVATWHLALSRDHVDSGVRTIVSPRHLVIFTVKGERVLILRLLHEAMNLPEQHLPKS